MFNLYSKTNNIIGEMKRLQDSNLDPTVAWNLIDGSIDTSINNPLVVSGSLITSNFQVSKYNFGLFPIDTSPLLSFLTPGVYGNQGSTLQSMFSNIPYNKIISPTGDYAFMCFGQSHNTGSVPNSTIFEIGVIGSGANNRIALFPDNSFAEGNILDDLSGRILGPGAQGDAIANLKYVFTVLYIKRKNNKIEIWRNTPLSTATGNDYWYANRTPWLVGTNMPQTTYDTGTTAIRIGSFIGTMCLYCWDYRPDNLDNLYTAVLKDFKNIQ